MASSKSRIVLAAGTSAGCSGGLALRHSCACVAKMRLSDAARFQSYILLKPCCRLAFEIVSSKGLHLQGEGGAPVA